LYAAAATIEEGQFVFGDDRAQNELTTWASVDPASMSLRSGARTLATVTIAVPDGATTGEHYGVIWVEARGADTSGVTAVNRVGVRMYISVGPGGEPASDFEISSLTASRDADGRPVVNTRVDNTGGRALDLTGSLELFDGPAGLQAGPFPIEIGTTLAPGMSAPAAVLLDPDLPDGPWRAVVTVASGTLEKRAQADITFPTTASATAEAVVAESLETEGTSLARVGLAGAVSLVVGGGLVTLGLRRLRRPTDARPRRPRRPREPARGGPPPPRPPGSPQEGRRRGNAGRSAARPRPPRAPRGR